MNEIKRTLIYGGVAIVLALLTLVTSPSRITPDAFLDKDAPFFPEFADPNAAATLEVIDFNKETGSAVPFKVTLQNNKWTIPSHYDHPADGKDRLAKTAAGVIDVKRDEFRSDNSADHEALGVIDPLDEASTSLEGRGQRITLKTESGTVLADLIVGKEVEGREKFRYVRLPDQKHVYASRMDIDISTQFEDWIESDLLLVEKNDINQVKLKDYSINERSGRVQQRDEMEINKTDGEWTAKKMSSNQEVDKTKLNDLLKSLDELKIVGVRPKPEGLSQSLQKTTDGLSITQAAALSLQSKGYYFSRDGQLLSNEGEIQAHTTDGVAYTLRFGEIVYGSGLALSAGTESNDGQEEGEGENRYLFITSHFNADEFAEPQRPNNTDYVSKADSLWTNEDHANKALEDEHDKWQKKIDKGQKISDDLNARFAKWYYVITSSSFDKLHLTREDLIKTKKDT